MTIQTPNDTLTALLNVYWLRPETALWRELDIRAMAGFRFESPSMDLGCGDGIFSFVRAGGAFSPGFDAFQMVSGLDRFFDNIDVYDAYRESTASDVAKKPMHTIDMAFDHKENLLRKAARLGLYAASKVGDANKPLPFPDASFKSLFSNIVYWLDDPGAVMKEIARVLQPGGRACLMLPNKTLPEFSFYKTLFADTKDPRWAFLERLDRGRFVDNIRQARPAEEWEHMFSQAGLQVVEHRQHLSKTIVQLWDIGLRPLFPVLKRMADSVPPDQLPAIKAEWVSTLHQFLGPLSHLDEVMHQGAEPAFHCYIVTPQP